jgi:NAD+ synthase
MNKWEEVKRKLVEWVRSQVKSAGAEGVIVGMSGGVDSSVVAVLCKLAFPKNMLGLIMPCYSSGKDIGHARDVAEKFGIDIKEVDLQSIYEKLIWAVEKKYHWEVDKKDIAIANMIPRLRMLTLYYFANKKNYLVAGAGNRSELSVGYFTKYGDGGVDILPLGGLLKTEVRKLAEYLGIPDEIIRKVPSPGLWEGQTDEGEMGVTYEQIDRFLSTGECEEPAKKIIEDMVKKSEHKRRLPSYPDS